MLRFGEPVSHCTDCGKSVHDRLIIRLEYTLTSGQKVIHLKAWSMSAEERQEAF